MVNGSFINFAVHIIGNSDQKGLLLSGACFRVFHKILARVVKSTATMPLQQNDSWSSAHLRSMLLTEDTVTRGSSVLLLYLWSFHLSLVFHQSNSRVYYFGKGAEAYRRLSNEEVRRRWKNWNPLLSYPKVATFSAWSPTVMFTLSMATIKPKISSFNS